MTFRRKSPVEPSVASSGPWDWLPLVFSAAEQVVILSATLFKGLVTGWWLFCMWWVICVTDSMTQYCLLKDSSGYVKALSSEVRGMANSELSQ